MSGKRAVSVLVTAGLTANDKLCVQIICGLKEMDISYLCDGDEESKALIQRQA